MVVQISFLLKIEASKVNKIENRGIEIAFKPYFFYFFNRSLIYFFM